MISIHVMIYNIENSENEFSDDENSTENMSVDEIIEDLFLKEKPEGEMCNELLEVRKQIWDLIKK